MVQVVRQPVIGDVVPVVLLGLKLVVARVIAKGVRLVLSVEPLRIREEHRDDLPRMPQLLLDAVLRLRASDSSGQLRALVKAVHDRPVVPGHDQVLKNPLEAPLAFARRPRELVVRY